MTIGNEIERQVAALREDVQNLQATVMLLVSWLAQSASGPINVADARLLRDKLEGRRHR